MPDVGAWVSALLVFGVLSFMYRENRLSSYVEHLFVGVGAGHFAVIGYSTLRTGSFMPLIQGDFVQLIPIVLGLMLYGQFVRGASWLSKIPMTFMIALGAGIAARSSVQAEFLGQIRAMAALPLTNINNILILLGTCSVVLFFYFKQTATHGLANRLYPYNAFVARTFLMVAFGAGLGNTIMTRISMVVGAFQFILRDLFNIARM